VQTVEQLEQNVVSCKTFQKMSQQEQQTLLSRTRSGIYGSPVEQYKKKQVGANHPVHHDGDSV